MQTRQVDVPEELLERLQHSRLGSRSAEDQVKISLAIRLYLEGLISIGKAAELSGEPRIDFEWLLSQMGLPVARYDLADYEQDLRAIAEAERRSHAS
jgi:predicted HTH domain antitoxin